MIAGLDSSSFRPTAAIAQQARADGVRLWSGYLQTRPQVGLFSPWDQASFENARLCGGTPIAWASGWDDPVACRQRADAWNVRLGVDVEGGGLRPDGPWIQDWLNAADASRTGLYGNYWVFQHGYRAAFYVVGGYPGHDPQATWGYVPRPNGPCGWQWQGGHTEYGGSVDRGWYDNWFLQGAQDDMNGEQDALLRNIFNFLLYGADGVRGDSYAKQTRSELVAALNTLDAKLAKVSAPPAIDPKALAAELAPLLPHLSPADVDAIAKASIVALGKTLTPPA